MEIILNSMRRRGKLRVTHGTRSDVCKRLEHPRRTAGVVHFGGILQEIPANSAAPGRDFRGDPDDEAAAEHVEGQLTQGIADLLEMEEEKI